MDPFNKLVDASNPVAALSTVVIYCTGLGEVNPPVKEGTPASLTVLSRTVAKVTATIGGRDADVQFAGLTPGFIGLYQVNAVVPSGVAPGNAVEVVLTAAGQASAPATIAVK